MISLSPTPDEMCVCVHSQDSQDFKWPPSIQDVFCCQLMCQNFRQLSKHLPILIPLYASSELFSFYFLSWHFLIHPTQESCLFASELKGYSQETFPDSSTGTTQRLLEKLKITGLIQLPFIRCNIRVTPASPKAWTHKTYFSVTASDGVGRGKKALNGKHKKQMTFPRASSESHSTSASATF